MTVDERDDDGERLRESVARAVDAAVGDDAEAAFVLVVDDAHALQRRAGLDALAAIADDAAAARRGSPWRRAGSSRCRSRGCARSSS